MKRPSNHTTSLTATLALAGGLTLLTPQEGFASGSAQSGNLSLPETNQVATRTEENTQRYTLEAACGESAFHFYSRAPQEVQEAIDDLYGIKKDDDLSLQEIKEFAEWKQAYPSVGENHIDVTKRGDEYVSVDVKSGTKLGGKNICGVDGEPKDKKSEKPVQVTGNTQEDQSQDQTSGKKGSEPKKGTETLEQKINKQTTYTFPLNYNEQPDTLRLQRDANGNPTGYTMVVFDGKEKHKVPNSEVVEHIKSGFETTSPGAESNYAGLFHVKGEDSEIEMLKYVAATGEMESTKNLALFTDMTAFYSFMSDRIESDIEGDKLTYDKNKFMELQESYKQLADKAGFMDYATTFTSPIGFVGYIFNGFSFDEPMNRTGHYQLNIKPNMLVIKEAREGEAPLGDTLVDRLEQNELTYRANLGGE